ncbi:atypical kinase COQ8B, mitochondrial [Euwallacea fornicatus]|uniref:atypical kinase COQ8B, mitochondrial n=1 Tax=Euwallacea fornicatus TaxID=995702 RepID=UPI00338EC5E5
MSLSKDFACLLKSLQLLTEAQIKLQRDHLSHVCRTSSVTPLIQESLNEVKKLPQNMSLNVIASNLKEGAERLNVVTQGLKVYADLTLGNAALTKSASTETLLVHHLTQKPSVSKSSKEPFNLTKAPDLNRVEVSPAVNIEYQIKLSHSDQELLKKLDMEHKAKLVKEDEREPNEKHLENEKTVGESINESKQKVTSFSPSPKTKLKLSENAKQRKVPSSRLGRMMSFGSLAAGLGVGAAAEYLKQAFKIGEITSDGTNVFMSKANLDRIVDTLCKVRGAALKLGQILSIQDESMISPELATALERVRKSADFMPDWQVDQVMCNELGFGWKDKFIEFEQKPFAAASIGQVHYGKLIDGRDVAVKIQYPGVAKGINSDIDNLGGIMKMWNLFPKGMFLENLMAVAKRELAWEVDYLREAECTKKFKSILTGYEGFYVPYVVDNLTTKQVFTNEFLDGVPVDQCFNMELEHRKVIGEKIMELCLLEILRFRYMQTDPNWANFLYNPQKRQLLLLDFGASREYSKEFMDKYVQVLKGACDGNREAVLKISKQLGFLTGYESKIMETAHVDAVMILGEVFRSEGAYDFAHQDLTARIQDLAQIMLMHRLCPPPEEVYSLHRKLSGVFLLLAKLKVRVECRQKFLNLYEEYMRLNPE